MSRINANHCDDVMDEKLRECLESNAQELIEESGDFRGHVYASVSADHAEPTVDWQFFEGKIPETRIEELEAGEEPTKEEAKLRWEAHMRYCFEEPDDDIMAGLWFCERPPGIDLSRLLVVLCHGYSYRDGPTRRIFGAFENEEDAMAALRREFYFCDDF
jgi:hypothetical protein